MKPKILVIVFSDLSHDARVRRQVAALKDLYNVTVACYGGGHDTDFRKIMLQKKNLGLFIKSVAAALLLARFYTRAFKLLYEHKELIELSRHERFDLVIANDIETLPLAQHFNTRIYFDAHEYAPRHFEDKLMWRIFFQNFNVWICQKYLPLVDAMTTVGEGLAEEYHKNFGIRPAVVTNANNFFDIRPTAVNDPIRIIHHGIATPSRKLEMMVEVMELLGDRFSLDFMLMVPGTAYGKTRSYLDQLKERARSSRNIKFIPPVKSSEVIGVVKEYDIGLFLLPPVNFNYANAMPNKLYDFIQGRLAIAIGPSPEMARLVKQFDLGVIADDFTPQSLAKKLEGISKVEIERYKKNADVAARKLNAEVNDNIIRTLVADVLITQKNPSTDYQTAPDSSVD